jgi:ankyrin repeat protein
MSRKRFLTPFSQRWDDSVMVKKLLAAGATIDVVDEDGKTPSDLASDQEVIEVLKQRAETK